MPFNETQQHLYQESSNFLIEKLNDIFEKSKKSESARKAVYFLLYVTLNYERTNVETIGEILYPEPKYHIIKDIFLEIHDLIMLKKPNHSLIKSILYLLCFLQKAH